MIEWTLWCLWIVIAFVSIYAFFLGIATPLIISPKRISSKFHSVRVGKATIPSVIPHTVRPSIATYLQVSTRGIAIISCSFVFVECKNQLRYNVNLSHLNMHFHNRRPTYILNRVLLNLTLLLPAFVI